MKTKFFFLVFGFLALTSCATTSSGSWIMDDGLMELTPEYTIQHIQGVPHSGVYAAFNSIPNKKLVRLREGDTLTVNGQTLQGMENKNGYYYETGIAVTEGNFTLTLKRKSHPDMTHTFLLPELGAREVPKVYHRLETLRVPVQYVEPPKYIDDHYSIHISLFPLVATKWKEDNKYQFDRLPDIQEGAILFRHILKTAPPPGKYDAKLFRSQHVVFGEMSDASRTGWANLVNTVKFTIEVK